MSALSEMSEGAKHTVDALSAGAVVATFFSWLPQISALLAAAWFLLRIAIGIQEFTINRRKLRRDM